MVQRVAADTVAIGNNSLSDFGVAQSLSADHQKGCFDTIRSQGRKDFFSFPRCWPIIECENDLFVLKDYILDR